jgi:hypothetical protein
MNTQMNCNSCEVLYIQGVKSHEHGCPVSYQDELRECKECGSTFTPEHNQQNTCDHTCWVMYNGLDCYCDDCCDEVAYCDCGECKHCTGESNPALGI